MVGSITTGPLFATIAESSKEATRYLNVYVPGVAILKGIVPESEVPMN
jgi:hypothetical protein